VYRRKILLAIQKFKSAIPFNYFEVFYEVVKRSEDADVKHIPNKSSLLCLPLSEIELTHRKNLFIQYFSNID
jgi:hypothetical protein